MSRPSRFRPVESAACHCLLKHRFIQLCVAAHRANFAELNTASILHSLILLIGTYSTYTMSSVVALCDTSCMSRPLLCHAAIFGRYAWVRCSTCHVWKVRPPGERNGRHGRYAAGASVTSVTRQSGQLGPALIRQLLPNMASLTASDAPPRPRPSMATSMASLMASPRSRACQRAGVQSRRRQAAASPGAAARAPQQWSGGGGFGAADGSHEDEAA